MSSDSQILADQLQFERTNFEPRLPPSSSYPRLITNPVHTTIPPETKCDSLPRVVRTDTAAYRSRHRLIATKRL